MTIELIVLGDLGSTFTKVACATRQGSLVARAQSATRREDLAGGFARARDQALAGLLPPGCHGARLPALISSSAAGGLRLCVVGKEASLTVQAGQRAARTAGARIVASYAAAELLAESAAGFAATAPDLVLLTGGASHGDTASIVACARAIRGLAPGLPVVVAGNEDAYPLVRRALAGQRVVRFAANVMPRVGTLAAGPAQDAMREVFAGHVMGQGRYLSASALAGQVRMPTPSAVLAGARVLSGLGDRHPSLKHPVVVDVGGATTDVHSVLDGAPARTVEGDLGLRENAPALLAAARDTGLAPPADAALAQAAGLRQEHPSYLPADATAARCDRRLAELAATLAIERHAGRLRFRLGSDGGVITRTGRDLRRATSVIATGGIFAHAAQPERIIRAALAAARGRGALVPARLPVRVDRQYALWAVGLLSAEWPQASAALAVAQFAGPRGLTGGE